MNSVFETRTPLVVAALFGTHNFRRILPQQFCSHSSQRPMKPLSKGYIFGSAHASSLTYV